MLRIATSYAPRVLKGPRRAPKYRAYRRERGRPKPRPPILQGPPGEADLSVMCDHIFNPSTLPGTYPHIELVGFRHTSSSHSQVHRLPAQFFKLRNSPHLYSRSKVCHTLNSWWRANNKKLARRLTRGVPLRRGPALTGTVLSCAPTVVKPYWNTLSSWSSGMPPPWSAMRRVTDDCALQMVTCSGGSARPLWHSTTARIAFFSSSYSM